MNTRPFNNEWLYKIDGFLSRRSWVSLIVFLMNINHSTSIKRSLGISPRPVPKYTLPYLGTTRPNDTIFLLEKFRKKVKFFEKPECGREFVGHHWTLCNLSTYQHTTNKLYIHTRAQEESSQLKIEINN